MFWTRRRDEGRLAPVTKRSLASQTVTLRQGEGSELAVRMRTVPNTNGSSTVEATFDLQDAPVPDRRYVADAAWLVQKGDGVDMVLAQRRLGGVGGGLLSAVVVSFTPESVRSFLRSCVTFLPMAEEFLARNSIALPPLEQDAPEPGQVVHVVANIVGAAHAGREAGLDLYQASPWALRALTARQRLAVEPVLRIDLRTDLLVAILLCLRDLETSLPPDAR